MYGIPTQPVITVVHVSVSPPGGPTPAVLTLDLTGSQLSKSATFKIDDDVVDKGLATVVDTQNPDDCQNPPEHFENLKVVITNPKPGWITGAHQVVVTNPDKSVSPGANFTI